MDFGECEYITAGGSEIGQKR